MISSNILPNILPILFFIAFERKIAQKKNAALDMGAWKQWNMELPTCREESRDLTMHAVVLICHRGASSQGGGPTWKSVL
jgi:hypothetical protein